MRGQPSNEQWSELHRHADLTPIHSEDEMEDISSKTPAQESELARVILSFLFRTIFCARLFETVKMKKFKI